MMCAHIHTAGVLYIMTHDSIGLGEDGPTHQPVEILELIRSTPNMNMFRPADGNEVTAAYISAVSVLLAADSQHTCHRILCAQTVQSVFLGYLTSSELRLSNACTCYP